jgi:hypothetical protein
MKLSIRIARCESVLWFYKRSEPYADGDTLQRYFEGGSSSVYLWDLEEGGFAGVVLLKKGESRANFHRSTARN